MYFICIPGLFSGSAVHDPIYSPSAPQPFSNPCHNYSLQIDFPLFSFIAPASCCYYLKPVEL